MNILESSTQQRKCFNASIYGYIISNDIIIIRKLILRSEVRMIYILEVKLSMLRINDLFTILKSTLIYLELDPNFCQRNLDKVLKSLIYFFIYLIDLIYINYFNI